MSSLFNSDKKKSTETEDIEERITTTDDSRDDEDDDVKESWKITKVKKYGKNDDVTEGMRAYVGNMKGDEDKVKGAALVEVTTTTKGKGDKKDKKSKEYFALVKVGGNWYVMTTSSAENINDAADKWEDLADKD